MAPSVGTLRVGRYFLALVLIFIALYAVVGFGSRQSPKLGIDLVGGKRVIFQARTTNGSAPSSGSMDQARQIIEDRVNGQGVTGATVQIQNGNQLVVTIPGGTNTDVKELGEPAILNFRGVMAPAQPVTCTTGAGATATPSAGASGATSGSAGASAGTSATTGGSATASGAATKSGATSGRTASNAAGNSLHDRRLAAGPTKGAASTAAKSKTPTTATSGSRPATGSATGSATGTATSSPSASASAAAPVKCESDPIATLFKTDPGLQKVMPNAESCPSPALKSGCRAFSSLSTTRQAELTSALSRFDCSAAESEADIPTKYYVACDDGSQVGVKVAYLLGHVVVSGSQISSAQSLAPGSNGTTTSAYWSVNLNLSGSGADNWGSWTKAYHDSSASNSTGGPSAIQTTATAPCGASAAVPCSDFVGFTLNGQVIAAPLTEAVLTNQTNITGNYSQTQADTLTQQLNYGKLPLSFKPLSNESVSATLGSVQLKAAFLAGGIGLVLVVLYSLAYYRGLGLITIASLLVSAGLTYAMLVILGTQIGFTLDLAGIAGFIVALGITADSFVVFFERIKDEVHEGRSMRVAVPRAWIRARRTILSADTVSFFAAAILYYFAAADVKGFAFTLGLSTILDLIVVFLFTHPIVSLLSRSRAFGSPRFTGLNSVRTGAVISDDDDDTAQRRRRPGRAGPAASARERAAGRRGLATDAAGTTTLEKHPSGTDTDDETVDAATDDVTDDVIVDDPSGDAVTDDSVTDDSAASDSEQDAGGAPGRAASGQTGGSAAERAAARRARRRAGGSTDSEGES